jgi:hypothetical protein
LAAEMDGGSSSAARMRDVAAALIAMAMRWLIPSQTENRKQSEEKEQTS